MPLEFALRPRIRIAEGFAPPRRSRLRVPKLVLPIAAYWLTAGAITYALIHWHDQPETASDAPSIAATPTEPQQQWWQPVALPAPSPSSTTTAVTTEPEPAPTAAVQAATDPVPAVDESALAANEPELAPAQVSLERPVRRREERQKTSLLSGSERRSSARTRAEASESSPSFARQNDELPTLPLPPLERELSPTAPVAPPTPDAPSAGGSLPSCAVAAASANQEIDIAHRDNTPDLSREAIAAVLDNGVWIARCDIPFSTSIELCVAIKGGSVIGVSVSSHPASAAINACVKRRAAGLHFPFSSRVDLAKTHF